MCEVKQDVDRICKKGKRINAEDLTRHTSPDSKEELEQDERSSSETSLRQPQNLDVELELPDPVQQNKPKFTEVVVDVIRHQDVGYMKFDQASGKTVVSNVLCTEMVEKGSIYFQNSAGPSAQKIIGQ